MRFRIAHADHSDIADLFRMGSSLSSSYPQAHKWTEEIFADLLSGNDSLCLAAKERKKIIGFITGTASAGSGAMIHFCFIKEHPLRDVVLEKLFHEFKKHAIERRAEKINFTLDRMNVHLVMFSATLGFQEERTLAEMSLDIIPRAD